MRLLLDDPKIMDTIATLPADPDRDRLTATYRTAFEQWQDTRDRFKALTRRTEAVVSALMDCTGKERAAFMAEQATNHVELDLLPRLLTERSRLLADAFNRWTRQVLNDLDRAIRMVTADLNQVHAIRSPYLRTLNQASTSTGMAREMAGEVQKAKAALTSVRPEFEDLSARDRALRTAQASIQCEVSNTLGQNARHQAARPGDIDRFVKRLRTLAA